jgi:hypothetical protein
LIKVLTANLWVLKTNTAIIRIEITAIGIEKKITVEVRKGKKISRIVIANARAEKVHVAMFATHRKNPVMNAENPPMPSLLRE